MMLSPPVIEIKTGTGTGPLAPGQKNNGQAKSVPHPV